MQIENGKAESEKRAGAVSHGSGRFQFSIFSFQSAPVSKLRFFGDLTLSRALSGALSAKLATKAPLRGVLRNTFSMRASLAVALVLACSRGACADTVQTAGARLTGDTTPREGGILVGGATVPIGEVMNVVRDTGANTIGASQAVRTTNGEIWYCSIQGLETNTLMVRGNLFGARAFGTEAVATLDFSRQNVPATMGRRGLLYREKGDPIPGTILWIREGTLAIDCPLGVLPVPRQGVIRYQFSEPVSSVPRGGEDEVGLIDGSVFRGRLSVSSNGVTLTHAALGELSAPWAATRYLLRSPPELTRLGLPAAGDSEVHGPTGAHAAPRLLDYRTGLEPRQPAQDCLTAVRMAPVTAARYRLQERKGRTAWFRAVVAPVPECRGDVRISLHVAGATIFERTLLNTNDPVMVSAELPPGEELTIKTDFGGKLLYPCGADWEDPCVVFRKE